MSLMNLLEVDTVRLTVYFGLGSDPSQDNFKVRISQPSQISNDRFSKRRSLLDTVDDHFQNGKSVHLVQWIVL